MTDTFRCRRRERAGRVALVRAGILACWVAVVVGLGIGAVQTGQETFAMADIHGNFPAMVGLMRQIGLIDDTLNWTGGDATFIQTGDYTDRGPGVRRVIDFLRTLQRTAPSGRVEILVGNHEIMNMMGDLRDNTVADYESFRDENSESRRRGALDEYLAFERRRLERLGLPSLDANAAREWLDAHPPGFLERREAFSAAGDYGKWLRERPVVVEHDETIFMHAGIHPDLANLSLDEINVRVHQELLAFDNYLGYLEREEVILPFFTFSEIIAAVRQELEAEQSGRATGDSTRRALLEGLLGIGNWLSVHPEGPLWFRGFAEWTDDAGMPLIDELLDRYDARRFVVGHTPQLGSRIVSRFGGRLYLADTGMLSSVYAGGRASILRIQGDDIESIYLEPSSAGQDAPAALAN